MEIKSKDITVTVKTITVNGKKMTKQFLQQIPWRDYYFKQFKEEQLCNIIDIQNLNDIELKLLSFEGTLLGFISMLLDEPKTVNTWTSLNKIKSWGRIVSVLFLNSNGELQRSYMDYQLYKRIFGDEYPQIYI